MDENISNIEVDTFKAMIETAVKEFPNFKVAATTLRDVKTATVNDWSAILWHDGEFHEAAQLSRRSRSSTASAAATRFASGLQFGFLEFNDAAEGRRIRRRPRRAGHDHPRRHLDGHPQGSRKSHRRRRRAGR